MLDLDTQDPAAPSTVMLLESSLTPRDYQVEAIEAARTLIRSWSRLLLVLPTGGGKTVIAALVIRGAVAKGKRALFLAHRREIVAQSFWKLVDAGVPESAVGVMMADGIIPGRDGQPYNAKRPLAPVQVASVQTLARRAKPVADVVFVDEAHHAIADSYGDLMAAYATAGARIVGLTATPVRGDGRGLVGAFDHLHQIAQPATLIAGGYLADPECWAMRAPDLSGVEVVAGDYDLGALGEAMDTTVLTGNVVSEYLRLGGDRTGVVFAVNTAHSRHIAERFVAEGIAAEHLDGTLDSTTRDAILRRLASGETRVVSNCQVLTEGWDLPRAKYLAVARPTKSLALYLQMVGRILRPWQGVSPVIVDHGGCVEEHGLPQEDRAWSLVSKKKSKAPSEPSARRCPMEGCGRVVPQGVRVCPACGYTWPALEIPVETDGHAERVTPGTARAVPAADLAAGTEGLRKVIAKEVWRLAARTADALGTKPDEEATAINRTIVRRWKCRRPDMTSAQLAEVLAWVRTQPVPAPVPRPVPIMPPLAVRPVAPAPVAAPAEEHETWTL